MQTKILNYVVQTFQVPYNFRKDRLLKIRVIRGTFKKQLDFTWALEKWEDLDNPLRRGEAMSENKGMVSGHQTENK